MNIYAHSALALADFKGKSTVIGTQIGCRSKAIIFLLMSGDFSKNFQTNVKDIFMEANSYKPFMKIIW